MSPGRLLSEYSGPELSEQMAFARVDPLPDEWWMMGQICTTVASAMSDGKTGLKPTDFIPFPQSVAKTEVQSAAEGIARMKMIAAAFHARQNRG